MTITKSSQPPGQDDPAWALLVTFGNDLDIIIGVNKKIVSRRLFDGEVWDCEELPGHTAPALTNDKRKEYYIIESIEMEQMSNLALLN